MRKTSNPTLCICFLFIGLMMSSVSHTWDQNFALGLVSDGAPKPDAEAAYNWAKDNYNARIIPLPKSKDELKEFRNNGCYGCCDTFRMYQW